MTEQAAPRGGDENLIALVSEAPLAWLVSPDLVNSTLLPLMPLVDSENGVIAIEGHMSRANPHVKALQAEKDAAILYQGPNSYMPPAWMSNKSLAPTWMFPSAAFLVEVNLMPEPDDTKDHLKRLVSFMEERNGTDWRPEEMGKRFDILASQVIAFRATIQHTVKRFKLGQNEEPGVRKEMVEALVQANKNDLARWVRRANGHNEW